MTGGTTAGGSGSPSAPDTGGSSSSSPVGELWRVGRTLGRTLYVQTGTGPAKGDHNVGIASTVDGARMIIDAMNGVAETRHDRAMSLGRLVYLCPSDDPLTDFIAAMDSVDLARRVAAALRGGG